MKPSTKKTIGNKVDATKALEPVAKAVEPVETYSDIPPEEKETEEVVTEEQAAPEPEEQSTPPQEPEQPEPPIEAEKPKRSDGSEKIMLGNVQCTLRRMPLELVQQALMEVHQTRVELYRSDPSIRELQKRMRASDGRCAPVVFTYHPEDKTIPPSLFAGIENIAAAINVGLTDVSVLLVDTGDAPLVQSYLIAKQREKPATEEEDFLMRVQSFHDD